MTILYDSRNSGNGWKIRQLLSLLGLPYERRILNLAAGESRTPEFLAINPQARVPVLREADGLVLRESNAILAHLAQGTPYLPGARAARAEVMQWLFFEQFDHLRNFARPRFLVSIARSAAADSPEVLALREQGVKALAVMEAHLAGRDYLAGGAYTIADIALYPYTRLSPMGGYDLQPYPQVRRWLEHIAARPDTIALP
ncbi:glutathione S-transferase family protein [Achromobacter denitrificans]|uniref:glutathione S-transferase family protein n=1 Tax=Achromobacter denitrificans TaxID=32002 RepID=UPI003D07DE70